MRSLVLFFVFLLCREDAESGYGDRSARFYLTLLLPREAWPTKNYGWLHDSVSLCLGFVWLSVHYE